MAKRGPAKFFTEKDVKTIRKMYKKERKSTAQIAEELGCSKSTVLDFMERHGIERRPKGSVTKAKLDRIKIRQILKMAAKGMNGGEIGRKFGVTRANVHLILSGQTWKDVVQEELEKLSADELEALAGA
jgi:DNA invertase Pin-like site-specific DNA recombinase